MPKWMLLALVVCASCRFNLDRRLDAGELTGRVVVRTPDGERPVARAHVVLEATSRAVDADQSGRFVFRGLPAATYALTITGSLSGSAAVEGGLRVRDVELAAADGVDLGDLAIGAFGGVAGSVDIDGGPAKGALVVLTGVAEAGVDATGFSFTNLVPGDYDLGVFATAGGSALVVPARTVTVKPREVNRLAPIDLTGAAPVSTGSLSGDAFATSSALTPRIAIRLSSPDVTDDLPLLHPSGGGLYLDTALPAGVYEITASLEGFDAVSVPFVLVGGDTTEVPDIVLASASEPDDGTGGEGEDGGTGDDDGGTGDTDGGTTSTDWSVACDNSGGAGDAFCSASCWCWSAPAPTGETMTAVWASSATDVWIATARGSLLHWDGASLVSAFEEQDAAFTGLWGSGPSDVWAVGATQPGWATGSATWTSQLDWGTTLVAHFDGASWTEVAVADAGPLSAVTGVDASHVYAVGAATSPNGTVPGRGVVLRFDGATWSEDPALDGSAPGPLLAAFANAPDDLFVGGGASSPFVLHFDGAAWSALDTPPLAQSSVTGLWSAGAGQGVFAAESSLFGGAEVAHWSPAGATGASSWDDAWTLATAQASGIFALTGSGADDLWATGAVGAAWHFDGLAWTAESTGRSESLFALWARPGVSFGAGVGGVGAPATAPFVVGDYGAMLDWTSAGFESLTDNPLPPGADPNVDPRTEMTQLDGVWGARPDDVWAVGGNQHFDQSAGRVSYDPTLGHFDGSRWSAGALPPGLNAKLYAVAGSAADDVWIAGASPGANFGPDVGALLHFDGASWTSVDATGLPPLRRLFVAAKDDVWAVGDHSGQAAPLLHFDGTAWSADGSAPAESYSSVWGSGPEDVWAGHQGGVVHFDGATWTAVASPAMQLVGDIAGSGPTDVWFSGEVDGAPALAHFGGRADCTVSDASCWSHCAPPPSPGANDAMGPVWANAPDDAWVLTTVSLGTQFWSPGPVGVARLFHFGGGGCVTDSFHEQDYRGDPAGIGATTQAASLFGFGPKDMWMVGVGGAISHRANR